jgi:hypothetical protein
VAWAKRKVEEHTVVDDVLTAVLCYVI